jgi:hypothetical protein
MYLLDGACRKQDLRTYEPQLPECPDCGFFVLYFDKKEYVRGEDFIRVRIKHPNKMRHSANLLKRREKEECGQSLVKASYRDFIRIHPFTDGQ